MLSRMAVTSLVMIAVLTLYTFLTFSLSRSRSRSVFILSVLWCLLVETGCGGQVDGSHVVDRPPPLSSDICSVLTGLHSEPCGSVSLPFSTTVGLYVSMLFSLFFTYCQGHAT